jgi:hypothetical protein
MSRICITNAQLDLTVDFLTPLYPTQLSSLLAKISELLNADSLVWKVWEPSSSVNVNCFRQLSEHPATPALSYLPILSNPVVSTLWFANTLGVRKIFQGVREEMSAMAYFLCSKSDKVISDLGCLVTAQVSEKITSVHCYLTRKTNV